MSKNITDAFEIPTDEEWDRYLSTNIFDTQKTIIIPHKVHNITEKISIKHLSFL